MQDQYWSCMKTSEAVPHCSMIDRFALPSPPSEGGPYVLGAHSIRGPDGICEALSAKHARILYPSAISEAGLHWSVSLII